MTADLPPATEPAWYRAPYFLLTAMLVLSVILYPLALGIFGEYVQKITYSALLFSGLYAVAGHRTVFRLLGALVLPVLVLNWFIDDTGPNSLLDPVTSAVTQLFLLVVLVTVFVDVLRAHRITTDVIFGSVAVYLLFGVVMAMAFQFVDTLQPGTVIDSVTAEVTGRGGDFIEFLYFSFITLTSVGYGDIAPLGGPARSLAMFEGVVGQLYMAILVARLVGIHIAQD